MQHTSFDVYTYADRPIKIPDNASKRRPRRRNGDDGTPCILLQRTLPLFSARGLREGALSSPSKPPRISGIRARETPGEAGQAQHERAVKGGNDSATTDRPGSPQLQSVGREPDARGLCAALHRQERAKMVERARRQHRHRRGVVPGAGSDRRRYRHQLWLCQRDRRDPDRGRPHFPDRPADRLLCLNLRRRHRPSHARRRLWLYRLDHHVADLRLVHLSVLRH